MGKDVSELEALLQDFRDNIDLAKDRLETAKEKYASINSFAQATLVFSNANTFLIRANVWLRTAYAKLVRIAKALTKSEYSVFVSGHGWLYARGNGTATIEGNGTVIAGVSDNGSVLVKGIDPLIRAIGTGSKIEIDNTSTLYEGYGSIKVRGAGIWVQINGTGVRLGAHGKGSAYLSGEGWYRVGGVVHDWPSSETIINVGVVE
jgi:hypothetical protein